jgi:hypothetical protein
MVRIDKNQILINFLDKIRQAKQMNMSDVRMSMKELDDLAYVITLLMSDTISKILNIVENNEEPKKVNKPIIQKTIIEKMPMKRVIEQKPEQIVEKVIDIQEEIEDNEEYLYGGTF